jgi:predicted nucleic acid-binding protein
VIVVDTSAVLGLLTSRPDVPGLAERIRSDGDLHAPHLLDVEFQHALRRLVVAGALSDDRAADARMDLMT